jgi:hypothetical protein
MTVLEVVLWLPPVLMRGSVKDRGLNKIQNLVVA